MHVILVHGMGRTPLSMLRLARFLRRDGHTVERAGYSATFQSFDRITERVRGRLAAIEARGESYAAIGHSLGGLVLRAALEGVNHQPQHLFLIGTPNRPARLAVRLAPRWVYRRFNGDCGQLLAQLEFFQRLPTPTVPYTLIAGSRGPRGRYSPFGNDMNDLVVAVDETRIIDADDPIIIRGTHAFLMNHPATRDVIRRELAACAARCA